MRCLLILLFLVLIFSGILIFNHHMANRKLILLECEYSYKLKDGNILKHNSLSNIYGVRNCFDEFNGIVNVNDVKWYNIKQTNSNNLSYAIDAFWKRWNVTMQPNKLVPIHKI